MTPEAQRIAISEACPALVAKHEHGPGYVWNYGPLRPFDPLYDLNAIHEAVGYMLSTDRGATRWTARIWGEYVEHLINVVTRDHPEWMCRGSAENCIDATAAQRAEAFLRTLNLWDDSK